MIIIGCDYHPGFQQIAYVDTDTGELSEARLGHKEQAEQFYHELSQRAVSVRVGMESSGHARCWRGALRPAGSGPMTTLGVQPGRKPTKRLPISPRMASPLNT